MNNLKTAKHNKDPLQLVPQKIMAEIDLIRSLGELCQDCDRPLADQDEYVCNCGATYIRK